MKLLRLKTNGDADLIDIKSNQDASWYADLIGCEWIEVVCPKGFDFIMIVDEEGLLAEKEFNYYGSYLYGTQIHGQPIVGDILIADTGRDGDITGLPDEEAEKLRRKMTGNYERIKRIFGG